MPAFVDTNILLYAVSSAPEEATKTRVARSILEGADWRLSVQVLQEFYVNAVRKLARPLSERSAIRFIQRLSHTEPLPVDLALMLRGTRLANRYQLSYWDGAIIAAAHFSACEVVLTEDLNDGQRYGDVTAMNPFR
ncbi:MAG: PIN domain-containing protein [Salinisphaera sp.]|nr:PIN domain-containing protein [Salinisphaera sp.]